MSNCNQSICTCGCCEESSNQTPLSVVNAPGLSALQYRVGTHSSFKNTMLREIAKRQALSKLTARYDDDMAIATMDAWATVLDVLSFYQERIINEGYLRTSTERISVLELARHISYKLAPGVAAGTFLSFTMNEATGNPVKVEIPKGTKVQSIPGQDESPQLFETIEDFEARVEWNSMPVQTSKKVFPKRKDKAIYLQGISTNLQPGDAILIIGDEVSKDTKKDNWDFRRIKEVLPNNDAGYTKVTWKDGLGINRHGHEVLPAAENVKVYAMKQKAFLFGYNAPDWRTMSKEVRNRFLNGYPNETSDSNTDEEWKKFTIKDISGSDTHVHLDNLYPKIIKGSWLVMSADNYDEVYKVKSAVESSKKAFTLASKTTMVELTGENLMKKYNDQIRDTVVYAQSEEFQIADVPVEDAIINYQEIILQNRVPGLEAEKKIILSGKRKRLVIPDDDAIDGKFSFTVENNATATRLLRTGDSLVVSKKPDVGNKTTTFTLVDSNGEEGTYRIRNKLIKRLDLELSPAAASDAIVTELHTISSVKTGTDTTVIVTKDLIENEFDPAATVVYGNVAEATHGETRKEVLGSGDGSKKFQKFELKQNPLTYISAATASGTASTLEIRVNDILWKEVSTFYLTKPNEKIYTVNINDDGKVTVMFGDGITGARLPTGIENVKATYRVGIGVEGSVDADKLTLLLTPQVGLTKVNNPLAASGGEDPETFDTAKTNAPLTVLTLDRIVSAKDFEDFTRAFAGIAKAAVEILWSGEQQIVHITFATEDKEPIDTGSALYINLMAAIKNASHANEVIEADNYESVPFGVSAGIKVKDEYLFDVVKANVEAALLDKFSFDAREFGQDVTPAEVIATIQTVEGAQYTDLGSLNGTDPFTVTNFRLNAERARWKDDKILPAQLYTIDEKQISITEITP